MMKAVFDIESGGGKHIDSSVKSGMCSDQLAGQQDGDSNYHGGKGKGKGKGKWREKVRTILYMLITGDDKLVLATKVEKLSQNLRDYTNGMLVVATLIATVSFTAGFTLPGGYRGDDGPDRGMAALARKAAFRAFLIFDTASMISSLLAIWFLAHTVLLPDSGSQTTVASFAAVAVPVAFYCMVVAFGTGVYVVIESRFRWLGITVLVSSCLMPMYVVLLSPVVVPGRLTAMKKDIFTLLRRAETEN